MRESILPADRDAWLKLRMQDITSTEASALFGLSPYMTEFELWHRKKNQDIVEIEDNEVMRWGRRLEPAIAHGVAEDNGWEISEFKEYIRIPELRIGSSFDFKIGETGILEIKNVFGGRFKDTWIEHDDGEMEAPPHIEIQCQHQLLVSGFEYAYIGALVSGNKLVTLKREPDEEIHNTIKEKVKQFWASIDADVPPEPNFEKDAEFISQLYGYASPNSVVDASHDHDLARLAVAYSDAAKRESAASKEKQAAKAEMLTLIGDAEKILGDGYSISAGVVAGTHIEYDRKPYRNFRVTWKKS